MDIRQHPTDHHDGHQNIPRVLKALIIVIVITLAVLCTLLVQQYQHIKRLDLVINRASINHPWRNMHTLPVSDASTTQAWMTFDYIDRVFSLPPAYLKTALSIADRRYPRLTIAEYAESLKKPAITVVDQVAQSIRSYSSAAMATDTSATSTRSRP
jgi:hypothetical protein